MTNKSRIIVSTVIALSVITASVAIAASSAEIITDDAAQVTAEDLASLTDEEELVIKISEYTTWHINNVRNPQDINLCVTYNKSDIPSALKNVVKKGTTATMQLTIGDDTDWDADASLTLKLKRAGLKARLYFYEPSSCSLTLIDTSDIDDNGHVTFDNISHGGSYYITMK